MAKVTKKTPTRRKMTIRRTADTGRFTLIADLAKEYGINTANIPNTSVSEYLRKIGRTDLSKVYKVAQKELRGV